MTVKTGHRQVLFLCCEVSLKEVLLMTLRHAGRIFPAAWGYRLMTGEAFQVTLLIPLIVIFVLSVMTCGYLLSKIANR